MTKLQIKGGKRLDMEIGAGGRDRSIAVFFRGKKREVEQRVRNSGAN